MRILPLVLAAAVTLPACTLTAGQKKAGVAAGVLTAIAGAAMVGYASTVPCEQDPDFVTGVGCVAGALELTAGGAVLAGVGLVVLGISAASTTVPRERVIEEPRKHLAPPPAAYSFGTDGIAPHYVTPSMGPSAAPRAASQEVRELTETARTAARQGSCRAVETIANRVAELDPEYRRNGFTADPDIAGCVE